ncbi:thioredoxin family protein [Agarilytica rhodophyticola]|uniref:thioredoxin family protein n=1 Tax=Agarilytica rhodophyticola TaxID=1737490 RepID=UPI000B348A6C|nr:thioredoxin domain-containing protein [Agarilytica rhodophyticola]
MSKIDVTDESFDGLLKSADQPLLVDVWAPWCGPCKMVGSALNTIVQADPTRFSLAMANMEEFEQTADKLNIKATPTLMIFQNGEEVARRSGAMIKSQIENWLNEHLDR